MMSRPGREQHGALLGSVGIATGLLAFFLVSGRWNLSRMTSMDLGLLGEPRIFIALLLLVIALAPRLADRARPNVRRAADRTLALVSLFYGYMALTATWAPDGADRMKLVELGLVLVCVGATLRMTRVMDPSRVSELVWRWLVPILVVFAMIGAGMGSGGGRLAVLGGGPNVFGRNMALLCVAMVSLVLRRGGSGFAMGAAVAGALVLLSGSRGALLACAAGVAVVLYHNAGRLGRVVHVGLAVAAVAVVIVQLTELGTRAIEMFHHRVLQLAIEDGYDSGRSDVYLSAWELGCQSPWFGIGLAGFEVLGNHVYPHNLFLEVFCEGGLVGIVLLMLVLAPPLVAVVRRRGGAASHDYGALVVVLFSAQFSGDLYDSRTVFVFGALLTVLVSSAGNHATAPMAARRGLLARRVG